MHLQFVHVWVLLLVWAALALAALWLLLYRRKQKSLAAFLAEPMLSKLAPSTRPFRFYWQLAFVQIGLVLLLIAAARPQWGTEERTVFQRGRDLIIALDVSRSMLARDVHPSRLQRAKADIQDLLRELRGDRVALFAFRGRAIQLCPLTTDYAYLAQILDEVNVESAPRGETNIGDAIEKALAAFEIDEGAHRALILISDGDDLAGLTKSAAEKARDKGVVVFTVGLGDPKGATIPGTAKADPVMTYQGKEVISKLHHETLKEIADITGGAYVPVGVANVKLGKLYSEHLSKITARDIEESLQKRMVERYQLFLLPGAIFLIAGALLSRGRLRRGARKPGQPGKTNFSSANAARLLLCLAFAVLFACGRSSAKTNDANAPASVRPALPANTTSNMPPGQAQANLAAEKSLENFPTGREGASKAQGLYRRGAYRRAALAYQRAMDGGNQRLQNDCLFNAGCSLYRAGDYAGAAESFNRLENREIKEDLSKVYYNFGCATYRLAEQSEKRGTNSPPDLKPYLLEKAGNAFQRSLRSNGEFQDAAANLAAVTNLLPKAREDAKLQALMAKYGNQPPPQLADTMLENQRNILKAMPALLTNAAPARISKFEELAAQQRANSDLLIPLKMTLSSALAQQGQAGQQQAASLGTHLEAVQNSMNDAYDNLRDIDNRSIQPVTASERGVYNLWKGLAAYDKLLREDILRQTNTIDMSTSILAGKKAEIPAVQYEQNEAVLLTRLFSDRFAQAVPPEGTPAGDGKKLPGAPAAPLPEESSEAQSTNAAPQISRETRTNILFLAEQAAKAQTRAISFLAVTNIELSLPEQRRSYDLLKEIEKLLPKDKNNRQNQNQDQKQDQKDQEQKDQKQDKQQQENKPPQNDQQPPPKQEEKPPQPKEQPAQPEQKDQKEMTPEQLRALLEKALQREKDHREEKMRDEYIPPSPVERDW